MICVECDERNENSELESRCASAVASAGTIASGSSNGLPLARAGRCEARWSGERTAAGFSDAPSSYRRETARECRAAAALPLSDAVPPTAASARGWKLTAAPRRLRRRQSQTPTPTSTTAASAAPTAPPAVGPALDPPGPGGRSWQTLDVQVEHERLTRTHCWFGEQAQSGGGVDGQVMQSVTSAVA